MDSWLSVVSKQLACSARFLAVLDRDLAAEVLQKRGFDPRGTYVVAPRFSKLSVHYDEHGVGILLCELLNAEDEEARGAPALVGWQCDAHPGEKIPPSDPLPPKRGCRVRAFFLDLPANLAPPEESDS